MRSFLLLWGIFFIHVLSLKAQFVPIPVTGFTQDVIAETGPSSLATTSAALDAAGSNKIMYSTAFAGFAGITAGLPANGTLVSGADTYQLANYNGNNAVFIFQGQSSDLTLSTPGSFARLRVVCFSTEGPSTVNISVTFTDNTTVNYISNYILPDWFYGSANIILQGFGRCSRTATGPWTPDGLPTNPKIYYIEIPLSCADIQKQVQKITVANVSTGGNVPFPNTVLLGLSGTAYSRNIIPVITTADCSGNNGSISLTVTGSGSPYSYVWNTNPVQTGPTATGLTPGTYTATITDAFGCTSTYTGIVPLNNNATLSPIAAPATICPGTQVQLSVVAGPLNNITWNPGNLTGNQVNVNPSVTTTYTVTGNNTLGCTATGQVTVTVNAVPASPVVNNATICSGASVTLQVINPQPGYVYNWYNSSSGGAVLATGISFITPVLTTTTTYFVDAINTTACVSNSRTSVIVTVNPLPPVPAANDVMVCSGANAVLSVNGPQPGTTYYWYSVPNGGIPLGSGTNYTVVNVTTPVTIYLESDAAGCKSISREPVAVNLTQPLPAPVLTLSTVTQTSLTFSWNAVPGATGYEITINGGVSYQPPSSGTSGTTHTISGLSMNSTVVLQVRALGTQTCETSILSVAVGGTTLSTKEIFVPNVFTPNGDGKNDILKVYGNYVASVQLRIFNQWGQLIFYSDNISQGWDGNFKGQAQPVGVYAYTLKATLNDNTVINKKGSINLIR